MQISPRLVSYIKSAEGLSLQAYRDAVGVITIGYGSVLPWVTLDSRITQQEADRYLIQHLNEICGKVGNLVTVPTTQGQQDALLDFAYNLGVGALEHSTLLHKLNAGDHAGASEEFPKWIFAGGKPLLGLIKRRKQEREWFDETQVPKTTAA